MADIYIWLVCGWAWLKNRADMTSLPLYIDHFHLADHLNPDLLRRLHVFQYPTGTAIFAQSGEQQMLYWLVAGKLQVNILHPNGKYSVLAFLTPLAMVGDLELFGDEATQTNVICTEPSTLLGLAKADVLQFGYDDPRFLRLVITHLSAKLTATSHLQSRAVLPLVYQLAAYLLNQPTRADGKIVLESKADLAAMLGTTSRHLNRTLRHLESEGIIQLEGKTLILLDLTALRQYVSDE